MVVPTLVHSCDRVGWHRCWSFGLPMAKGSFVARRSTPDGNLGLVGPVSCDRAIKFQP